MFNVSNDTINLPVRCPSKTFLDPGISASRYHHMDSHMNNSQRTRNHHLGGSAGGQITTSIGTIQNCYLDPPSLHFLQTWDGNLELSGISNGLRLFQGIYYKLVN